MRWSQHGAHMLMQVRTAEINGELGERLRAGFREPEPQVPSLFKSKPPLLQSRITPEKLPVSNVSRLVAAFEHYGRGVGAAMPRPRMLT
jgi:hypothetical protein